MDFDREAVVRWMLQQPRSKSADELTAGALIAFQIGIRFDDGRITKLPDDEMVRVRSALRAAAASVFATRKG